MGFIGEIVTCPGCGCDFTRSHGRQKYCTLKCGDAYRGRLWGRDNRDRVHIYYRNHRAKTPIEYFRAKARRNYALRKFQWLSATHDRKRAKLKAGPDKRLTELQWKSILEAWEQRCAYCDSQGKLTQDHWTPLSKGGLHTMNNIVPACVSCNGRKGNRTIEEFLRLQQEM